DPVLTAMAQEVLGEESGAAFIASLREGRPEADSLALALARAHASGAKLEWGAYFAGSGAKWVKLPTYAFQRRRFWVDGGADSSDPTAIGQLSVEHPLLSAALHAPEGESLSLTGRLSLQSHPWLQDHAVAGAVLLPGTAFLELALYAAERVGAGAVAELTLAAPLVLPEQGAVAIQVAVGEPDEEGRRQISIHSHAEDHGDEEGEEAPQWIRHASGSLGAEAGPAPQPLPSWPPAGAEEVELADFYERLADVGLEYGPAFQGLTAAWKQDEEIYAEVELSSEQREAAEDFGIHPALLDSALHASILAALGSDREQSLRLPFSWSDVSLRANGAAALRVQLQTAEQGVSLAVYDESGAAVAAVGSLATRAVSIEQLAGAAGANDALFGIAWNEAKPGEPSAGFVTLGELELPSQGESHEGIEELSAAIAAGAEPPALVLCRPSAPSSTELAEATRELAGSVLSLVQEFLAAESLANAKLVLLTERAIAAAPGESPDLASAPLWGLLRTAQSEHPARFVLVDGDGTEASLQALPGALALDEPQVALREGRALVPRIARLAPPEAGAEQEPSFDPEKTVLVTGGTGGLGSIVARHLVEGHGARHLLLASRGGGEAEGAEELRAELAELGAEVEIAACDVAEPDQVESLLGSIPKDHPLGAVIHTAGTVADGVIGQMGEEQIDRVFAPKLDAAWNLHRLTAGSELSAFVMFSSMAGALGGPGQANYAAANVFLDALAAKRQAEGLAATSIAWGLWAQASAMTKGLSEADLKRVGRFGIEALSNEQGLELFDLALGAEAAPTLAIRLNRAGLRAQAAAGALPPILSGLVRAPAKRAVSGSLKKKLAGLPEEERGAYVLGLVVAKVAAVLGHESGEAVDPDKAFQEIGFDSLAAVELRNRLGVVTGLNLSATLVFDYPNSAKLADHLLSEALSEGVDAAETGLDAEFGRLEMALSEVDSDDQREEAAARLRKLLADLRAGGEGEDLAEASDEEIFEALDRELGQLPQQKGQQ
ncbi:MAG TPA: type I polyketide synthase, partial [Gaiellaceae bacterium]|nr:type I polyketide synthase [Gaiellaceae bacterium]